MFKKKSQMKVVAVKIPNKPDQIMVFFFLTNTENCSVLLYLPAGDTDSSFDSKRLLLELLFSLLISNVGESQCF